MFLPAFAVAVLAASAAPRAVQPDLATVLQRAGAYATHFYERLSGIVAEEQYTQKWDRLLTGFVRAHSALGERRLRSDLALVRPAGSADWLQFRDVFEVDGTPVRDRAERLTRLFLAPSPTVADSPDVSGAFRTSTDVWVVEYDEVVHPTLIRTGAPRYGEDLPAHGRFWIEPDTGRVRTSTRYFC